MEIFFDIIRLGKLIIQLSVLESRGFIVILTANDEQNRRIFKAPVLEDGKVKIFETLQDAILAAKDRLLLAGAYKAAQGILPC